jgi:hypothetical protein
VIETGKDVVQSEPREEQGSRGYGDGYSKNNADNKVNIGDRKVKITFVLVESVYLFVYLSNAHTPFH